MQQVKRLYVEKKPGFNVEAYHLLKDLKNNLNIVGLNKVQIIHRYDLSNISEETFAKAKRTILSEANVDNVFEELIIPNGSKCFAMEFLPGQYDQRADSAAQCISILTAGETPTIFYGKVIILHGDIIDEELKKIKGYCINPVDSREASLEKPLSLELSYNIPKAVEVLNEFIELNEASLIEYKNRIGLVMNLEDFKFCQSYFRDIEKRNPTITEMKVIDTYWSDHCRHTTFLTAIDKIDIEAKEMGQAIKAAYNEYLKDRAYVYPTEDRDITLMDIATLGMKKLKKEGKLKDLDLSEEINACSIAVEADINGKKEEWLVMFKNETHNHPTEIEPFGGAATCLGGAIRDPLSGRVYVYQAMRVTGSGDPRRNISDTLPGKLPQRKITTGAALGYSSYGNQIGIATGHVAEVYHEDFIAKRMEIGAVIGGAPKRNVIRKKPKEGDIVILLGGRTGRDGCGGATGSSIEHTEDSISTCSAEVQKGNPPTERKIQRLFRNPEASRLIKKCNDFGAGGVSVAIGELTDGIAINLDVIPKKYEGLDGTELAISESQERMAVVVAKEDSEKFIELAHMENLEAVEVATVTSDHRMKMFWNGKAIVNINREFLNTNGVKQHTKVYVKEPSLEESYFTRAVNRQSTDIKETWLNKLQDLNVASQKGLVENFDSTIGAGTILMPFGGKYQSTPTEGMASKLPTKEDTTTGTLMSHGYNPELSKWSPFHGGVYAIVEAVAKIVAMGGDYSSVRLSLQEYFEKLGNHPEKWGKPFSALLGAHYAQMQLGIPAIGGKDSMSGTFKDVNVPPTLVAFAVNTVDVRNVISPEFKRTDSSIVHICIERDVNQLPNFHQMKMIYSEITKLIHKGIILSAYTIKSGGIAEAISKMSFGNKIGVKLNVDNMDHKTILQHLFFPNYGSLVVEISSNVDLTKTLANIPYKVLGDTTDNDFIQVGDVAISLMEAQAAWENPLESVFTTKVDINNATPPTLSHHQQRNIRSKALKLSRPRIFIPVFPGTNCEYDTKKRFEQAGGVVEEFVFRNITPSDIKESIKRMVEKINHSQIIAIPGGFSGGDEPDGSGKFIATVFRNPLIADEVMKLIKNRDGLILGICNGFQALIKLGLVPYGEIRDIDESCPTLTFNEIGKHMSCMVKTRVSSVLSPWFNNLNVGDIYHIPVSHGEGRFVATKEEMDRLVKNGQIATQYVDFNGEASYDIAYNPNGSYYAVEGITSPDGRILGKMGHSERIGKYLYKNIPYDMDQKVFEAGVDYFRG